MRTHVILLTVLVVLLALPVALHAQDRGPRDVTEDHVDAFNNAEVDAAREIMAEDATVTVPEATSGEVEADPAGQTQYTGTAEYQAWLNAQAVAKAQITLGACSVEGARVTCDVNYTSETLKAKGVDVLEGVLVVTVVEGKIQSYAFTLSAESVTKLQSASAPAAVPVTGGAAVPEAMPVSGGGPTQGITYILGALAVLGLLFAGAASARGAKN